jgi:putative membrane protein
MKPTLQIIAAAVTTVCLSTSAFAATDKTFLKKALEGDNSEMALGQMAEQGGASEATRSCGRMFHTDPAAAKAKALPVAQAHGVTDTEAMAPEAKAEAKKLKRLHGEAFDREFARYMVDDHKKDISDFEKEAKVGDAATAGLARETLPDLRHHLEMAEKLSAS